MDALIDKSTRIGLGYATHSDAFQCGREAAQEAKNQLGDGPLSLVLIVGPESVHFKDFIEGARLVVGEETLVAVPAGRALSTETTVANACFVLALQAPAMRISIAADELAGDNLQRCTTALVSQFRRSRGNAAREFGHRGGLFFSNEQNATGLAAMLGTDMSLESWLVGAATTMDQGATLVCANRTIQKGVVGIEFLSSGPWGVGSVQIGPFMTQADVYREAVKTALRDALGQMPPQSACFGIVLFNLSPEVMAALPGDLLASAASIAPALPLLGISATHTFVRRPQRSVPKENDSIIVLLVPA